MVARKKPHPRKDPIIKIEAVSELTPAELIDLCEATEATITDNKHAFTVGLKRTKPFLKDQLEAYWKGVLLVPERQLIIGRIDNIIAASIQLVLPPPSNQTSAFAGQLFHHFVAPWARGHGLARKLLDLAEIEAQKAGLTSLRLDVRAKLIAANRLYDSQGYKCWGTLPKYEFIDGKYVSGNFYYKNLITTPSKPSL